MKKYFLLGALLLSCSIFKSLSAQVYNPGGSAGIGSSSPSTGVGIGISGPRASLDVHYNCVQGGMATLLVTGSTGFLTCSGIGNNYGETFRVRTETAANVYRDDFVVKAGTGRIGIGTFNPKTKLHIQDGSIRFTGTDPVLGSENIVWGGTSSAPDGEWAVEYNMNLYGHAGLNFWRPNQSSDGNGNPQITTNAVLFLGNNNHVGVNTNNPIANLTVNGNMLVGDPGFVNINTTTPYGLYVQNGILTSKVRVATVNGASWADYVFQPGYHLRPLSEVNSFITANGHLPGVPSASDVQKDGVDLLQMNATLLEKVEELTLYVIEQQKQIDELKLKVDNK